MHNILITSAGQRVSLVRAFQKELKQRYPGAMVFTTDVNPELSPACNVSDKYFKVKSIAHPDYIQQILQLCLEYQIGMIVPTLDIELLKFAESRELFKNNGIQVVVPGPEFVKICRDKRLIADFFKERNISVPELIDKNNPVFPLFIKPYDGSLSSDTFLIRSKEELTDYHYSNQKLLFMEYIDKDFNDEYTVDMYYGRDNKIKCIVPRKRIKVRSGEINKGLTCKNEIVEFLKEKLDHIDTAIGCLTLQLFLNRETGKMTGIEINPRFGGGFPLSYLAGGNYPGWLIDEYFINKDITYTDKWEDELLMLRYDDEILVHGYKA